MRRFRVGAALVLVALLAGCESVPAAAPAASACAIHEASWECQVERYHNINVE